MVFFAVGRVLHADPMSRPAGRQLLRAQLDPVRTQQVPSRATAVRRRGRSAVAVAVPSTADLRGPGKTREIFLKNRICNRQ